MLDVWWVVRGELVPDLSGDVVEHDLPAGKFQRASVANERLIRYVAEHDRPSGVGMDEMMREFGMSVFSQGPVAIAMKDAVRFGYVVLVSPRVEQARWRITAAGIAVLGMDAPIEAPDPDADDLKKWARGAFGIL